MVNLAVGALTSMSGMDYQTLKQEFTDCPYLNKAAKDISAMDLVFEEASSSTDLLKTLEQVTNIFKVVAPAWKQCPNIKKSEDEQIKKVTSMLEIFANPSTYDLYTIALGAFTDWKEVNQDITKALEEFNQGKCARSGFVIGNILRKIIESDTSLTNIVWGGIQKTAETI